MRQLIVVSSSHLCCFVGCNLRCIFYIQNPITDYLIVPGLKFLWFHTRIIYDFVLSILDFLVRSFYEIQEIIYDPSMKSKYSYMILSWKVRIHAQKSVWFNYENKEIIYDPNMKSKKSYMDLVWKQRSHTWSYYEIKEFIHVYFHETQEFILIGCMILVWNQRNHIWS